MGDLIGGVIDGLGSIFGSNQAAKKADEGATTALTGYNYLAQNQNNQTVQNAGTQSARAGQTIQNTEQQLLGVAPITAETGNAFNNYLGSTGYNFQLDQGVRALAGSAAAKGILNSGATAKAITGFGQNLASNYFNQYLAQLQAANGQAQASANAGLTASGQVGQAGTQGGATSGQLQASAGQSAGTGTAQAFNYLGGGVQSSGIIPSNPFGSVGSSTSALNSLAGLF